MSRLPDVRQFLDSWPYDPENYVRLERGVDGREIILVRLPMGLEEYEVDGRPDGKRVQNSESALEYQQTRLTAAKNAGAEDAFKIGAADCIELFDEGTLWYYRFLHFCRLKDWVRVERDTRRNLQLLDFLKRFAEQEEDRAQLEPWRPDLMRVNAVARAMILLEKGQHDEALKIVCERIEGVGEQPKNPRELAELLLEELRGSLARRPAFRPRQDAAFLLRGDYWTIRYQGQVARLRTTRGLQCLASLLRRPGKEFHVSELIAEFAELPVLTAVEGGSTPASPVQFPRADALSSGPILDPRAKAAYRHRLKDLREDLTEAEGFGDWERTARVQEEMNCIAEQLATAVGLGGKKRPVGSHAERARSTVTKRIRDSINKIGKVIPALGRHLSARVKTGYFCSYNPHPDRPVSWKF